jgi:integrase
MEEDIQRLAQSCRLNDRDETHEFGPSLSSIRDKALLLIGFAGAFRRSELIRLDVAHIRWTRDGMTLLLERSKRQGRRRRGNPYRAWRSITDLSSLEPILESIDRTSFRARDLSKGQQVKPRSNGQAVG